MSPSRLALAVTFALAAAACGSSSPAATTVDNRAPTGAADPVATLEALAAAIDADDGAAFAALVDPTHGLTLWYTPGAGYAVLDRVEPGDTAPPSKHVGSADGDGPNLASSFYWPGVKTGLRGALARLDRDPADPHDPIYGTCEDEEPREYRAYLVTGRDDASLRSMDLAGDGDVDPASVVRGLVHLQAWGVAAYLAPQGGGWRVLHLVLSDPCSA